MRVTKRLLLVLGTLMITITVGCGSSRHGVTRYNSTKQMHKHGNLDKIPRSKAGREQKYKRKGPKNKIMNKSK